MKRKIADIFYDPRTVMWFGFAVFEFFLFGSLTGVISPTPR
jgi:hypothetical protein